MTAPGGGPVSFVRFVALNMAKGVVAEVRADLAKVRADGKTAAAALLPDQRVLTGFRSLGHAVQAASAEYKAGKLSAQEYAAVLAEARREAIGLKTDVGELSGKQLTSLHGILDRTSGTTTKTTASLNVLRSGVNQLAFAAASIPGVMGRAASSLLTFSAGSQLAIGVVAGFGVVAGAVRILTKDLRDVETASKDAAKAVADMQAKKAPEAAAFKAAETTLDRNRDLLERLEAAERARPTVTASSVFGEPAPSNAAAITKARQAVLDQQAVVDDLRRQFRAANTRIVEDFLEANEENAARLAMAGREADLRRLGIGRLGVGAAAVSLRGARPGQGGGPGSMPFEEFVSAEQRRREARMDEVQRLRERGVSPQDRFARGRAQLEQDLAEGLFGEGPDAAAAFEAAVTQLREEMERATKVAPKLGVAVFSTLQQAIHAVQAGDPGGLLGLAGSVLGKGVKIGEDTLLEAMPVLGTIFSVGGALASLFGGGRRGVRIDEYSQRALDQMHQRREGPERVVIQIVSPTTGEVLDEIEYDLGRRSRLDRVIRIPRGVSLRR